MISKSKPQGSQLFRAVLPADWLLMLITQVHTEVDSQVATYDCPSHPKAVCAEHRCRGMARAPTASLSRGFPLLAQLQVCTKRSTSP